MRSAAVAMFLYLFYFEDHFWHENIILIHFFKKCMRMIFSSISQVINLSIGLINCYSNKIFEFRTKLQDCTCYMLLPYVTQSLYLYYIYITQGF